MAGMGFMRLLIKITDAYSTAASNPSATPFGLPPPPISSTPETNTMPATASATQMYFRAVSFSPSTSGENMITNMGAM